MFGKRKLLTASIGILVVLVLLGSGSVMSAQFEDIQDSKEITVTDARGVEVTFEEPPERIISFMASNTEILFHLEVGDRVVATDEYSDYPPEVNDLPKVGDSFSVDYETIIDLEPDVVVTPWYNTEMIETLKDNNLTVVATASTTLEDVYSDMKLLGEMCGIENRAEEKVGDLRSEMENITEDTRNLPKEERIDTFYITGIEPIYTPGNNTFQNTLIEKAGGRNIAGEENGWWTISEETIIAEDPEVIIAPDRLEDDLEELVEEDHWQDITAVENEEIHYIDGDIMSRPGPRIVNAEENLTEIISEVEGAEEEENPLGEIEEIPSVGLGLFGGSIAAGLIAKKVKKWKA
ncbi:MAG: ABC transporter substrate-binding protein [Candidatus Thermoplasmatota archaeon]|nr:ABC transporter substrate-binding protein [Candidatus Thermoplasmatota archaeon]